MPSLCIRQLPQSCRTPSARCTLSSVCRETTQCALLFRSAHLDELLSYAKCFHGIHELVGCELRSVVGTQNQLRCVPAVNSLHQAVYGIAPSHVPGEGVRKPLPRENVHVVEQVTPPVLSTPNVCDVRLPQLVRSCGNEHRL